MAFMRASSPHAHTSNKTGDVMRLVALATLPGLAAMTLHFGWGSVVNVFWAIAVALGTEALVLKIRNRPVSFYLKDNSALVTGLLLGLAMPPFSPWWLTLVGVSFAIVFAKHIYGGMGFNPFNPAMVGYVLLLISFPVEMSAFWLAPTGIDGQSYATFADGLKVFLGASGQTLDGFTMATPLDTFKTYASANTAEEIMGRSVFGEFGGKGWEIVNLGFLLGGAFLLYKKVFTWHAPVSMLIALALMALIFNPDENHGSVGLHLLSGATMLGAFFIITDPVTSATSNLGRIVFGAGVGILLYVIRVWGNYPDAVAFAVLIMNMAAPTIDYYTQPRTYGHSKANRGIGKSE